MKFFKTRTVLFTFLILLIGYHTGYSQASTTLSSRQKAYLFHTIRKSPILERNIGRYIEYTGKEITLPNGEINYDSTELVIMNQPEKLKIYDYDIRRAPKGILAELANKMAVWELNQVLHAYRNNRLKKEALETEFEEFEEILLSRLPSKAIQEKKGKRQIHKKLEKITNPSLTFNEKVAMLNHFSSWTEQEKQLVIQAFNETINEWVKKHTIQTFNALGGRATLFENVLTAAGDGSNTSGLFEEREKDERGRWNKGLPKSVGLFPYETEIRINEKAKNRKKKEEIVPLGYTSHTFMTPGEGRETNIHLDVWGYNSEKQTTVVIEKSGKYYPLFGSEDSRFLSPDSNFNKGETYYSVIQKIETEIDELEELISGKKGIDYWLKHFEEKKIDTRIAIDKSSKNMGIIRTDNYATDAKKLKYDKKKNGGKKKHQKNEEPIALTSDSKQKSRRKTQHDIVYLQGELDFIEKKLKQLEEEKEKVIEEQGVLTQKAQIMYGRIGKKWVKFEEKDYLYEYEDAARFDLLTQEFTLPPTDSAEVFEVRLLAIPVSHKNDQQFDEVMLHINVTDAVPAYTSQLQFTLNDAFNSNDYQYAKEVQLLSAEDSLAVMEIFEGLLDKKKNFDIVARGGGIGKWKNGKTIINYEPEELSQYPGNSESEQAASKEEFRKLRATEVMVQVDRNVLIEINSFTDPVRTNFEVDNKKVNPRKIRFNLSNNQVLSVYRTRATLLKLKDELNHLASEYLPRNEASKVIDRINKEVKKAKITVGATSLKMKWLDQ